MAAIRDRWDVRREWAIGVGRSTSDANSRSLSGTQTWSVTVVVASLTANGRRVIQSSWLNIARASLL